MSDAQNAMSLALDYLQARVEFEAKVKSLKLENHLGGNDNFVGRIGEFLAMRYLEQFHGLAIEHARGKKHNESRPATDLLVGNIWWSVKCLTLENDKMVTSKYRSTPEKGDCPPLVVIWFGLDEGSLRGKLLAYPKGLPSTFQNKSLSMKQRFCGSRMDKVPTERAELSLESGMPKWQKVMSFTEAELIHRDKINVDYILRLLGRLKKARTPEEVAKEKKAILDMIAGEVTLRSKRELIQKFIEENLPLIHDVDAIPDEFDRYVQQEKTLALGLICEEEKLDREQFSALMESYIYSNQEPIRDDILQCLGDRPSVLQARHIGERILERMRGFVSRFVEGMVG